MNYRKYPNPIDQYRVSYFRPAVVKKQDREIRDVMVVFACMAAAIFSVIVQIAL